MVRRGSLVMAVALAALAATSCGDGQSVRDPTNCLADGAPPASDCAAGGGGGGTGGDLAAGGSGGTGSGGAGAGGSDCDPHERVRVPIAETCSNPQLAPGTELRYSMITEMVRGCGFPAGCTVEVDGGDISATVNKESCLPTSGDGCINPSRQTAAHCWLPPLQEGTYRLSVNGEDRDTITVTADSSAEGCSPSTGN